MMSFGVIQLQKRLSHGTGYPPIVYSLCGPRHLRLEGSTDSEHIVVEQADQVGGTEDEILRPDA